MVLQSKKHASNTAPPTDSIRFLALAWYAAGLAIFTYVFQNLHSISDISGINVELQFGGHYQFLTILGLWTSRLALILGVLSRLFPSVRYFGRAKILVCIAALPTETLISLLYWSILALDPSLLMPPRKIADPSNPAQFIWETIRLPLDLDLAMHLAPAIILLVDYLAFSPRFPRQIRPTIISVLTTLLYGAWCEVCAKQNGHYPYPILSVFGSNIRLSLYAASAITFAVVLNAVDIAHVALDKRYGRIWDTV